MTNLELYDLDFISVPQKNTAIQFEEFDVLFENKLICKTINIGNGWILVDPETGSTQKYSSQEDLENKILEIVNTPKKGNEKCSIRFLS
jgi:hypothetical protein